MPRNEVFALIDELTLQLQNARRVPLMGSVMVNQQETIDMLKRIVSSYDPSLENARKVIANEESIIKEAAAQAEKTLSDAQAQAQGMVNEANTYAQNSKANADRYAADTVRSAEENARAVTADAQARAQQMIDDAKAHADELVSQTTVLARAQAQAQELLDGAAQHANAIHAQTQHTLSGLLEQVDSTMAAQLDEIRMMKQNIKSLQPYQGDIDNN